MEKGAGIFFRDYELRYISDFHYNIPYSQHVSTNPATRTAAGESAFRQATIIEEQEEQTKRGGRGSKQGYSNVLISSLLQYVFFVSVFVLSGLYK